MSSGSVGSNCLQRELEFVRNLILSYSVGLPFQDERGRAIVGGDLTAGLADGVELLENHLEEIDVKIASLRESKGMRRVKNVSEKFRHQDRSGGNAYLNY